VVLALDLGRQRPHELLESLELRFVFVEVANAARAPDAHLEVGRRAALDERRFRGQRVHDRLGQLDVAPERGYFIALSWSRRTRHRRRAHLVCVVSRFFSARVRCCVGVIDESLVLKKTKVVDVGVDVEREARVCLVGYVSVPTPSVLGRVFARFVARVEGV